MDNKAASAVFLIAFVLFSTSMVASLEEEIAVDEHRHKLSPAHAPVSAPKKEHAAHHLPHHGAYPPTHHAAHHWPHHGAYPPHAAHHWPHHGAYPPTHHLAHPPQHHLAHRHGVPPSQHHHDYHGHCEHVCINYCKKHKSKRECVRDCVPCCDHYKCVPEAPYKSCRSWDEVKHHDRSIKCPKY